MSEDEAKRDLMRRWLVKAWHELAAAGKLSGGPDVYLDVAIYHCQQAAEKALKALRRDPPSRRACRITSDPRPSQMRRRRLSRE